MGKCQKIIGSAAGIRNLVPPTAGRDEYRIKQEGGLYLYVSSRRNYQWWLISKVEGKSTRFDLGRYSEDEEVGTTLKMAVEKARIIKEEIKAGVDHAERSRKAAERQKNTFAAVRKQFMQEYVSDLADNTRKGYQSALTHDKLSQWDNRPVFEITRTNVREAIHGMAADTPVMANRTLAYLRKFFNWCADEEIIRADESLPTDRVKMPLRDEQKKRARKRWLSDDEVRVFLQATDKLGYPYGALFQMMLYTGQRKSEVIALKWLDIQGAQWLQQDNKAGREHIVPLNGPAMALKDSLPEIEGGYLFTAKGGPLNGFSKAKTRLDELIAEIVATQGLKNIFAEPWQLHDLRRTATTHMRMRGIDRDVCSRILNHAERGVTALHYDQFDLLPEKTHAMGVWGGAIELIMSGKSADVVELKKAR